MKVEGLLDLLTGQFGDQEGKILDLVGEVGVLQGTCMEDKKDWMEVDFGQASVMGELGLEQLEDEKEILNVSSLTES